MRPPWHSAQSRHLPPRTAPRNESECEGNVEGRQEERRRRNKAKPNQLTCWRLPRCDLVPGRARLSDSSSSCLWVAAALCCATHHQRRVLRTGYADPTAWTSPIMLATQITESRTFVSCSSSRGEGGVSLQQISCFTAVQTGCTAGGSSNGVLCRAPARACTVASTSSVPGPGPVGT